MPPNNVDFDNCPRHAGHEQQLEDHERRLDNNDTLIQKIYDKLDLITGKLLARPGWAVCMIFSLLMAALASCITIIVTLMKIKNG